MAKKAYIGVDGIARKIKKGYIGIKTSLMNVETPVTGASGYATVESNKVVFRYTEHKDSYFFININQTLLTGNYYTVSFDCSGIDDETHLTILVDNKSENAMLLKNGRMSCTFKPNRDISDRLLMDDLADWTNVIGKEIVLSNFAVEEYGTSAVARKIKKAYIGIGGVARPCWGSDYYGPITDFIIERAWLAATTVGNYAIFGGGMSVGSYPNSVDAYDTSLTRSNPTALQDGRYKLAATTVGNYALFGGSDIRNYVDAYDTSLTKSTATAFSVARSSYAATTVGDYALFGGGKPSSGSTYYATVDAYNKSKTRSTPTELRSVRMDLAATTVGNYAIFGGGRLSGATLTNNADAYDTSLTKQSLIGIAYRNYAATTIGDYALFGGGYGSGGNGNAVISYDKSLTRSYQTSLSVGRSQLAATTVGDYALFGGGSGTVATVDAYDKSLTLTKFTDLSVARSDLAATTVGNYALFGGGFFNSTATKTVDAYVGS